MIRQLRFLPACLALVLLLPGQAAAQRDFLIEGVGGVAASLAGFGVGVAIASDDDCGDSLDCILDGVFIAMATASLGAGIGTYLAGRAGDTEPSLVGGLLGGVLGVAAGLGLAKLADEAGNGGDTAPALIAFSVGQGTLAALGSRLGAALRGDGG